MKSRISLDIEESPRPTVMDLLGAFERELFLYSLMRCGGNQRAVARDLGITPNTVFRKLRRFGLLRQLADARQERRRRREATRQECANETMETAA